MVTRTIDSASAIGKAPAPEAHFQLAIVGAGPAGLAAALAAAQAGARTLLVDENPIEGALMAMDVPLHFGQRFDGAVHTKGRIVERVLEARPDLEKAFELGIDVQLGVYAWGAFVNSESVHSLTLPLLGLADEDRSWMVSFDRLIVATGARDLGIAFDGWDKPGVMGGQAALSLLTLYRSFSGRRLLILGSTAAGLLAALLALDRGLEVAAVVEIEPCARGPRNLVAKLQEKGVPLLTRHAIASAEGVAEVEAVILRSLDAGQDVRLDCDTIVNAIGRVPSIDLLQVLGCDLEFRPDAGGHVAATDAVGATSLPRVYAVGDCRAAEEDGFADPAHAAQSGLRAAAAVLTDLGFTPYAEAKPHEPLQSQNVIDYWQCWAAVERALSKPETHICLCEAVSLAEIAALSPPRYLAWKAGQMDRRGLAALASEGPINQDQVKRLTRAGMGPCQGRRCREQIQMLLSAELNVAIGSIPLASYRAPIRPLPLATLADQNESEAIKRDWVAWFNIPSQWTPHWQPHPETIPDSGAESGK